MHIQFDEQDSPENTPVEQKVPESQIKKELNGPKDTSEYVAVTGIVRDTSEEEDLENVTVGGYGVVWKGDVFPVQSGSYAGEANVNIFMELAASKLILELCPPEQPLIIAAKDAQLVTLINTKKAPVKKRKRTVGPLLEEVRSMLLKRPGKVQAVRYGTVAAGGLTELYQAALQEATTAREERLRLRPVKLEEILPRSTKQLADQPTDQQQKEQNQVDHAVPENKEEKQSTPITAPSSDIQNYSSSPAPAPAPAPAPLDNKTEALTSTPEEEKTDRRNGKKQDDDSNVSTVTDNEQPKKSVEESMDVASSGDFTEEVITATTTTTTTTETTTPTAAAETTQSNGHKRTRTEDEDDNEPTFDEPNTLKKVKLTEEPLSRSAVNTENDKNNGTQTGWLSWVKSMFGIKQ